jgi:hypothetical protein
VTVPIKYLTVLTLCSLLYLFSLLYLTGMYGCILMIENIRESSRSLIWNKYTLYARHLSNRKEKFYAGQSCELDQGGKACKE